MGMGIEIQFPRQPCLKVENHEFVPIERFMSLSHQYIQGYCRSMVSPEDVVRAQMLSELLFVRSGAFCLDDFTLSDVS